MPREVTSSARYFELLKSLNYIDEEALEKTRAEQERTGEPVDTILLRQQITTAEELHRHIGEHLGIEHINLAHLEIPNEVLKMVPIKLVYRHKVLPVSFEEGILKIATADPLNFNALEDIQIQSGCEVKFVLALSKDILEGIKNYYGVGAETVDELMEGQEDTDLSEEKEDDIEDLTEDASIIRFVNQIMSEAVMDRATDIHFEPFEDELRIRYRIDGLLYEAPIPPSIRRFQAAIISRIKIMADMNIAEKRLPQDGRIEIRSGGHDYDLRVSTVPTPFGESISIRILNRSSTIPELAELGLDEEVLPLFNNLIGQPHGIILVTGPTGSGKTTTLYSSLAKLNSVDRKIITIEDPIEYQMHGITQIQVIPQIGLTFANVLRSILRQDPDVLLVGETRDHETAEITIRTALTGHLVFSTLHTNDAAGAVTRLLDMGIEPYLVSSSVIGIIAQRLVRVICPECREEVNVEPMVLQSMGIPKSEGQNTKFYRGKGCENCRFTGFRGRVAIFEILKVSEAIRELVVTRASASEIKKIAMAEGMKTLRRYGWKKIKAGITTIEEVLRVTQEDEFQDIDYALADE